MGQLSNIPELTFGYIIIGSLGLLVLCLVVYQDADNTIGNGLIWFVCCIFFPPALLIYAFIRIWRARGPGKQEKLKRELERGQFASRGMGDVERLRYSSLDAMGEATMHVAPGGPAGFPHFADSHAEELLEKQDYAAAWEHLAPLYLLALEEHAPRAQDTYLHYILRLPCGRQQLSQLLEGQGRTADDGSTVAHQPPPF